MYSGQYPHTLKLRSTSDMIVKCIDLQDVGSSSGPRKAYMGHYQKMEQSLSLMVFSQARCPRFAFSMYSIIIRDALLEPHAISRFRVCYLKKRDARRAILSIFTVSLGQGK